MSLTTWLPTVLTSARDNQSNTNQLNQLQALNKIVDRSPKPFIFIQTANSAVSSNGSAGVPIVQSPVIGRGYRGVVRDFNINFGTVAGTVKISKINSSQLVTTDITTGITNSLSGQGSVVLEEGEAIAIVGQSAGAGLLGAFFSGDMYRTDV